MISDVMFEAVEQINSYIDDGAGETARTWYSGELRERIVALREVMDALRQELDTPPSLDDRPALLRSAKAAIQLLALTAAALEVGRVFDTNEVDAAFSTITEAVEAAAATALVKKEGAA